MERDIWGWLVPLVQRFAPATANGRFTFEWSHIVLTFCWAVLHTRPVYWACHPANWPDELRPPRLPTPATMSRRLRHPAVLSTLRQIVQHLQRGVGRGLCASIDGKPFPVARHSRDPDARFGRGAGGLAKGYKLHLICGENQRIEAFAIHPLNVDEWVVARELVSHARLLGYLLADANYDDNQLHACCAARGLQLVAPRRRKGGLGHRRQQPARLRAIEMLEHSWTGFGPQLHRQRRGIERTFGNWTGCSYGAFTIPPWGRRLPRVQRWLTASLAIFVLVQRRRKRVS